MKRSKIADLSVYLPERVVLNAELENRVAALPAGSLERLFGIRERRFAAPAEQVSDLAARAARPIVERTGADRIGFLIFAAACSDLIEPATCNIVQVKLGLRCPAMDVKNACNSFTTGLMTASSLIAAGVCDTVLVVNGEKLSDAIRLDLTDTTLLRQHLAAYSFGDAGAAALVQATEENGSGFQFQRFMTRGEHWPLCMIPGGGSLFPHTPDKHYFEGYTTGLKDALMDAARDFFHDGLREAGWAPGDIRHLFTHQVSVESSQLICQVTGIDPARSEEVFPLLGNTAAASIPVAMFQRFNRGEIRAGDKVVLLGLAAGVSVSLQLLIW